VITFGWFSRSSSPEYATNAAHLFFQLVSRRYERGSILLTSNRSVGEWGTVFGEPMAS
jgi:DNA replication protein DnaC